MGKKLFISNLDFDISTDQLRDMFTELGPCVSVVIATDRETKRSKGFAFIEMEGEEDAKTAIEQLNNKVVNGRPMKVCEDRGKTGGSSSGQGGDGASGEGGHRRHEQLPPIQRMQLFKRRRKIDPFLEDPTKTVDYKDVATLGRFVSERGKILSRRLTGLNAYNQRKVAKAIKRAQNLGLMPFTNI
jgi:small subunit ribosomal protein S18